MRRALLIVLAVVAPRLAHAQAPADAVALLPLDADQRLEIYGQPVASEIARTLVGGGIDVVIVGPRMAVPERARLIVDGTITGKGDAVTLTVRVRDPRDGTVLETIPATAPALTSIDRAAAEVSEHVLPVVKKHLAALHAPRPPAEHVTGTSVTITVPAQPRPLLAAIVAEPGAAGGGELRGALDTAFADFARSHHHTVEAAHGVATARAFGISGGAGADLGIALEVLAYRVEPGLVPMAHARVRVRVVTPGKIDFDRVVVTDTILGDRNMPPAELAARTAREVLAIVQPNLKRAVPAWR